MYYHTAIKRLKKLSKLMGIEVEIFSGPEDKTRYSSRGYWTPFKKKIRISGINEGTVLSLAHELGHVLLEMGKTEEVVRERLSYYRDNDWDFVAQKKVVDIERAAWKKAFALLRTVGCKYPRIPFGTEAAACLRVYSHHFFYF